MILSKLITPDDIEQTFGVFIGSIKIGSIFVMESLLVGYTNQNHDTMTCDAKVVRSYTISISFYGPEGITQPKPEQKPKNLIEAMNYFLGQLPDAVKPFVVFTESK